MYQYEAVLFKIIEFLPSQVIDYLAVKVDVSDYTQLNKRQAGNKTGKVD